ncbi:MAG: hypothetical protein HOH73_05360 [Alphaproteobacteria bacterium]|jgi:hypothetical protein|nr:hypothetical protein [Alphaproteobacteria bacterium]
MYESYPKPILKIISDCLLQLKKTTRFSKAEAILLENKIKELKPLITLEQQKNNSMFLFQQANIAFREVAQEYEEHGQELKALKQQLSINETSLAEQLYEEETSSSRGSLSLDSEQNIEYMQEMKELKLERTKLKISNQKEDLAKRQEMITQINLKYHKLKQINDRAYKKQQSALETFNRKVDLVKQISLIKHEFTDNVRVELSNAKHIKMLENIREEISFLETELLEFNRQKEMSVQAFVQAESLTKQASADQLLAQGKHQRKSDFSLRSLAPKGKIALLTQPSHHPVQADLKGEIKKKLIEHRDIEFLMVNNTRYSITHLKEGDKPIVNIRPKIDLQNPTLMQQLLDAVNKKITTIEARRKEPQYLEKSASEELDKSEFPKQKLIKEIDKLCLGLYDIKYSTLHAEDLYKLPNVDLEIIKAQLKSALTAKKNYVVNFIKALLPEDGSEISIAGHTIRDQQVIFPFKAKLIDPVSGDITRENAKANLNQLKLTSLIKIKTALSNKLEEKTQNHLKAIDKLIAQIQILQTNIETELITIDQVNAAQDVAGGGYALKLDFLEQQLAEQKRTLANITEELQTALANKEQLVEKSADPDLRQGLAEEVKILTIAKNYALNTLEPTTTKPDVPEVPKEKDTPIQKPQENSPKPNSRQIRKATRYEKDKPVTFEEREQARQKSKTRSIEL